MVTRELGEGVITYLGAWLEDELMRVWAARALERAGVEPILADVPDDIEVAQRVGAGRRVLILVNHADSPRRVVLPQVMQNVLAGGEHRRLELPPHDVAVLQRPAGSAQ